MRIVQLTSSSAGGVARHARQAAELLAAAGHRVLLAGPPAVVTDPPVPAVVVDIADRPRASDLRALRDLRDVLRGADLVHAHGLRAGAAAVVAAVGLRPHPTIVVTLHNVPVGGRRVRAVAAVLERVVVRGADVVLGVSGDLVARTRRLGAPGERALVPAPARAAVDDGVAGAELRAGLGLRTYERLVLTVARLAPQKGLDVLADAAALLDGEVAAGRLPSLRWVVVGDGPLATELQQRVIRDSLPVVVAGRLDNVPNLMAVADVVVSTSSWEGQPLVVQEALQAGAAIVATDVGGTGEVAGDAAVLVPFDAAALATAVGRVLRDDVERDRLRGGGGAGGGEVPT
ncbi:glycosyltransferase family 4 protein [Georgenia sp. MJ170]|uniref:glycosyltransferase family 4 protein n=1 Tax=Georgenia sunbinii TaxID=3117728 RepID=UPI002F268CE3